MPYADTAKKREYNRQALATPAGRENNAQRQRKHRHKKGNDNYRMRQATTYWKFKLRNGTDFPELIKNCTPEQMEKAEADVREQMRGKVEMVVREVAL